MTRADNRGGTAVHVTRPALFLSALTCLPGFAIGEWAAVAVGMKSAFNFHDVFTGFWGALAFAAVLAITRTGESA
jgi:hypothetical protein